MMDYCGKAYMEKMHKFIGRSDLRPENQSLMRTTIGKFVWPKKYESEKRAKEALRASKKNRNLPEEKEKRERTKSSHKTPPSTPKAVPKSSLKEKLATKKSKKSVKS